MVISKRKKSSRQRGNKTHGWGSKKKHRGCGNRGGRRHAGTGKRADSKKPSFWKNKKYFGRYGFDRKPSLRVSYNPINIGDLDDSLEAFIESGAAKKQGNAYELDLTKTQYNKLLGKGKTKNKFKVKVDFVSSKAIEKIEQAGGEVVSLQNKKTDKPENNKEKSDEEN